MTMHFPSPDELLPTPVTSESLTSLCVKIKEDCYTLKGPSHHRLQKLARAAEKAFADRALLLDENRLLFEQNNEKQTRISIKSTVTGNAKVMSYDDIVEAQAKRDRREAKKQGAKCSRGVQSSKTNKRERSLADEAEDAKHDIKALGLEDYCSVLQF
jgi:hypothetical protein